MGGIAGAVGCAATSLSATLPQTVTAACAALLTDSLLTYPGVRLLPRHVVLPAEVARLVPKGKLLSENEWRQLGVQQSRGWVHYAIHR